MSLVALLYWASLASTNAGSVGVPYERPAGAAEITEPLIVAGYRALFTCSAHFFAGRPLDDILKVELAETAMFGFPPPVIDTARQRVSARGLDGNARIAVYRDSMGCTLLPPHWSEHDIPRLPYVSLPATPDVGGEDFPVGDRVELPQNGVVRTYDALTPVVDAAFAGGFGEGLITVSVLIVKDGRLIAERYRPGFGVHSGYRTWSTAKSITAAIMGVAVEKGIVDIDGKPNIPEWGYARDPRLAISNKHLFWMSSGLYSQGSNTNAIYFGGQDVISAATKTALEVEPGARWKYANNDTLLLLRGLRASLANDDRYLRFPYENLLHRIGMYHTRMEIDHLGNFVGSSQVYTTARDLARFGLLLANDGVWQGERVLPEGWVEFLTTAAQAKPPRAGESGYAAQFWLLDQHPGVPPGTYTSAGNKGQLVTVVPSEDLVVVRTGVDPFGKQWRQHEFIARLMEALGGS
ncbi:MAG: serine hydrolase domain-containing protein [Gammaproteobacteria bacterium]